MTRDVISLLCRHPVGVLLATLLVTVLAGYAALNVQRDQSIEVWFLPDDPDLQVYSRFTENFRADEIFVIGVFSDDLFDLETWEAMEELAEAAAELPFVYRVLTPTSVGLLNPYADEFEPTLREQALANSLVRGTFVAPDESAAAIVVQLSREGNSFANKRKLAGALREMLDNSAAAQALDLHIAGTPVSDDVSMRHNEQDMTRIVPLMILMIVCVGWLIFRRLLYALMPLCVVLFSAVWMFGFMGVLGFKFTLVSTALLPLVLAVGVADSIHLLARFGRQHAAEQSAESAVIDASTRVFVPCLFTSGTTAAGLLALLVSQLQPIREFALVASFGVMAAFVLSFLLLPASLMLAKHKPMPALSAGSLLTRWLDRLGVLPALGRRLVLAVSGVVLVGSVMLATRTEVGVNPMAWFKKDEPVRVDTEIIDRTFGGSLSVEFLVSGGDGAMRERAVLEQIDAFERWLERESIVSRVISIVDVLKEQGRAALLTDDAEPVMPSERALPILLDGMAGDDQGRHWVDASFSEARLSGRIPLMRAREAVEQIPMIEQEIRERFAGTGLNVDITGYANLMVKMQTYALESQINSLALAFFTVTVLVGLLLRSAPLAVVAMIPNLVPVAVGLGGMYVLGIGLNPGTVMVGAIMLGIVVDDTVHFLVALRRRLDAGELMDDAVRDTLGEVGMPVLVTSLILALGFASLALGDFGPSRDVGMTTALVVSVALLADLVLLPAVLRTVPGFVRGASPGKPGLAESYDE